MVINDLNDIEPCRLECLCFGRPGGICSEKIVIRTKYSRILRFNCSLLRGHKGFHRYCFMWGGIQYHDLIVWDKIQYIYKEWEFMEGPRGGAWVFTGKEIKEIDRGINVKHGS